MPVKSATPAEDIRTTIRTLDSKINLVVERLKTLESNQEIAGRTLLALKDQVRRPVMSEKTAAAPVSAASVVNLAPLEADVKKLKSDIKELTSTVEELKYVLDQINPLNYATVDQVKDLLDEKVKKK